MFKLLLSGIAIGLISLTGNTQAQIPPASTTPTPKLQPTSPTSTALKATDLPLLTRAIGKFWQTDSAETESKMEIELSDKKGKTKYFVSVKTIAKVGEKFRSELTVNRVGKTTEIKYIIVSDGKKTWIYRPDLLQYAQIDTNQFYGNPSTSIIGLSSSIFTSLAESQRQGIITDILGENARIFSLENFKEFQVDLQVGQQQIDGRNLFVYKYEDIQSDISSFVNPQTGMFERVEVKFKFGRKQNSIEVVEKIIKRNAQVIITDETFTFSPPRGAKKVKSLEIEPFNLIKIGID
jgi:outer membrane lipoprotein-sorting protein